MLGSSKMVRYLLIFVKPVLANRGTKELSLDQMPSPNLSNLMGKPLMARPECTLRETSRYTQASGATIIRYDGADGQEYHCTIHTNGMKTWSGFQARPPQASSAPSRTLLNR